jgi:hypothetical protein
MSLTSTSQMKCPHCLIHYHENWEVFPFRREGNVLWDELGPAPVKWAYRSAICPACQQITLQIARLFSDDRICEDWRQVCPIGANRGPAPADVPNNIAQDYIEACNVLPISAKASAALARRCLQKMLNAQMDGLDGMISAN